jgi:hypothetical protein
MGMVLVVRRTTADDLSRLRADPELVPEFAIEDEDACESGDLIDFDKAWHALHFILTGQVDDSDQALSLLRTDYEPMGEDLGYGPPQYLSPDTMRAFNQALAGLSDDDLQRRYDPAAMAAAKVYLADFFVNDENGWEYLSQSLPALRKLAQNCAATNSGAIVVIT